MKLKTDSCESNGNCRHSGQLYLRREASGPWLAPFGPDGKDTVQRILEDVEVGGSRIGTFAMYDSVLQEINKILSVLEKRKETSAKQETG